MADLVCSSIVGEDLLILYRYPATRRKLDLSVYHTNFIRIFGKSFLGSTMSHIAIVHFKVDSAKFPSGCGHLNFFFLTNIIYICKSVTDSKKTVPGDCNITENIHLLQIFQMTI